MKERLQYLDIIRGIATIMIVIHHFNKALERYGIFIGTRQIIFPDTAANGNFGVLGVSLFFIISGASLMYVYRDNLNIKRYSVRRIVSIFPLFYIAYAGAFLCRVVMAGNFSFIDAPKRNFIFTVLGVDGYIDYKIPTWYLVGEWFLGCIIIMYILFPMLRKLMINNPELTMIIGLTIYVATVQFNCFEISLARNICIRVFDLLFGMYFVYRIKEVNKLVGAGTVILLSILFFVKVPGNDMYGVTLVGILTFLALVWISMMIKNPIIAKSIKFISKYSYGIFLTHHMVINLVIGLCSNRNLNYLTGMGIFVITLIGIGIATMLLYFTYNILGKILKKVKEV